MAEPDDSKWVSIRHPENHGKDGPIGTALREEFETNLKAKGWVIVASVSGPQLVPGEQELAELAEAPEAPKVKPEAPKVKEA